MSKDKAPGGAFSPASNMPAILLNRPPQGSVEVLDASPVRIARMLRQVFKKERAVRAWDAMSSTEGKRLSPVDGKLKWVKVSELVGDSLREARHERDEHLAELNHTIDYALTTVAYKDVPCPKCRLPTDALDFVRAVPDFEPPAIQCKTCMDRGAVRSKKTDEQSVSDAKLIKYWEKVLPDYIRCIKIKAGAADANEAYEELETANRNLLLKFGSEKQTSLEGDDALQGVRQGILDAARRFNPLKMKNGKYCCASFTTVAYNWCRRNSRARHSGQKRAGVYAPSIETLGKKYKDGGETSGAAMITSAQGALGTLSPSSVAHPSLILDMREKVAELPELQRAVIGFEMQGLATGEISRRLDITPVTVRKLRTNAFETLRDSMAGYVDVLSD